MKKLFAIVLLMTLSVSALAAELRPLIRLSDDGLNLVEGTYKTLELYAPARSSQLQYESYKLKVQNIATDERYEGIIAQSLFLLYTDYAKPAGFKVKRIEKTEKNILSAVNKAAQYLPLETAEDKSYHQSFAKVVLMATMKKDKILVYTISHGNSFGDSVAFALVDAEFNQFLVIGSSYHE
jgi:hypothetical protein